MDEQTDEREIDQKVREVMEALNPWVPQVEDIVKLKTLEKPWFYYQNWTVEAGLELGKEYQIKEVFEANGDYENAITFENIFYRHSFTLFYLVKRLSND